MRPGADREGEGLTIAEAARAFGVSENAVRQRIKRESITAHKIDDVWRIWLPDREGSRSPDHKATSRAIVVNPAALAQLEAIRDQWLQPLVDQLKDQAEQIGRLSAEKAAAIEDAEHLREEIAALRAARDRRTAPATGQGEAIAGEGSAAPQPVSGHPGPSARPWWRFWGR